MYRKQQGVTLIELMIVIVVISILASVAVPSYQRYLQRAQRSDATTAILRMQTAQEKNFLQYGRYVTTTANVPNAPGTGASAGLGLPIVSERGLYNLAVASTTTGYTITATPVTGLRQASDYDCASMRVNESGTKYAASSTSVDKTATCFR